MLILQVGEQPSRRDQDWAVLEQQGIQRERANTLEEALAFIEMYDFDIVIADMDFCRKSGFDLVREVRLISPVPIIGITTSNDPRVKIAALDMGADDVLTQLCGLDETLARVRAVVRRRFGHAQSTLRSGRLQAKHRESRQTNDGIAETHSQPPLSR